MTVHLKLVTQERFIDRILVLMILADEAPSNNNIHLPNFIQIHPVLFLSAEVLMKACLLHYLYRPSAGRHGISHATYAKTYIVVAILSTIIIHQAAQADVVRSWLRNDTQLKTKQGMDRWKMVIA